MSDIVIAGYLGFANSGDEALLRVLLEEIKRKLPGKTVTVLSMKPKETEAAYGVRAVNRYNMIGVSREFSRSKLLVFGGGSLLQDVTSRRSLYYYLYILRRAIRHGMKTMLLANGIGPLLRDGSRRRTAKVLNSVDLITLRDSASAELLRELGVTADIKVTADPAFMTSFFMPSARNGGAGRDIKETGLPDGGKYAVISVRPWKRQDSFVSAMAALCDRLSSEKGINPLLVPMQFPYDMAALEAVAERARLPVYIWRHPFAAADIGTVLPNAELVIAMRLHMLIFAAIAGVPFAALSYDSKVEAFMKSMDMPYMLRSEEIERGDTVYERLSSMTEEILSKRDELSDRILTAAERERERAAENFVLLAKLMNN